MSQQAKPGRRTPLSLGQPKGDVRQGKAMVNLEKLPTDLLAKQSKNGSADAGTDTNKAENGQNNGTNNGTSNGSTTKKEGNGVQVGAATTPVDNAKTAETAKPANDKVKTNDKAKEDKVASPKVSDKAAEKVKPSNDKAAEKAKPSTDKVTSTNDKQKSSNDSASAVSKVEEKTDAKNGEKEVRESVRQKQIREEKEKEESVKAVPSAQPAKTTPSTPDKNAEAPKVKDKRKPEAATPTKTPKATPSESLLAEKSLKGFNENLEEAESSKINESPAPTKILKLSQGAPTSASRSKRSDKLDDASLVVNLSTVSELSNESNGTSTPVERNYSLRQITGRRSTRPLREISFDFRMRESYYKDRNECNDSVANTNSTSITASPCITGQVKRSIDDSEAASPKRSRFDFGLLEFVSSPVKKIGAKFSRSRLSTSTPNKLTVTEEIPSGIEAEHFAADDEEMASIELNAVEDVEKDKKMDIDTEIPPAVEDEGPIEVHEPSKSRCSVM